MQKKYGNEVIDELKVLKQTIMKRPDFDRVIEELSIEELSISDEEHIRRKVLDG